jgi:hypothetical protein
MPEVFETAAPAHLVFCHEEFLEKLAAHSRDSIGKRASLLLQRLAVDTRRLHFKATYGANRGWRRSRLGGSQGSHYYAWWAPAAAPPIKSSPGFAGAPEGSLFVRDLRHHDDHSPLDPQSLEEHYLPVGVPEIRGSAYAPPPWTGAQENFAAGRASVRILKGHPGSGKTTALWHAADQAPGARVLYVTYSRDLAALAKEHFDRFCSREKTFRVLPFPAMVRQMGGLDAPFVPDRQLLRRFEHDLHPFHRHLGVWQNESAALFDEMHAHLAGGALPFEAGRFAACTVPRVADKVYRQHRTKFVGPQAAAQLLEVAGKLEREGPLADRYFPELSLAWRLLGKLAEQSVPNVWYNFDCIAIDECQDLTPLEMAVVVQLAARIREKKPGLTVLIAGDEAQTVRPTDFEWGWLNDLLHARLATPEEHHLGVNLRSPRRIAAVVNSTWDLYRSLEKQERPSGSGYAEIEDESPDQVWHCVAASGPALPSLMESLAAHEGLALVTLEDEPPAWVPASVRAAVLNVREAKGLDFHSVCVLDAGRTVLGVLRQAPAAGQVVSLLRRLHIDKLRVAVSRPSERLIILDVDPGSAAVEASRLLLRADGDPVNLLLPEALLPALDEQELDLAERIKRCESDSYQYIEVRPELAWSRAHQAVALLGARGAPGAIEDEDIRNSVYENLAFICIALAMRRKGLPAEVGHPDLLAECEDALRECGKSTMAEVGSRIRAAEDADFPERQDCLVQLAQYMVEHKGAMEPWLLFEIKLMSKVWVEELELALKGGSSPELLTGLLPGFYDALEMDDAAERAERMLDEAISVALQQRQYGPALALLRRKPERQLPLEALCAEGLGRWAEAAACYREAGQPAQALHCYREAGDIASAAALLKEIEEPEASAALEWVERLRELVSQRPAGLCQQLTPAERKVLEELAQQVASPKARKVTP